ncbi:hypothetical protein RJT34_16249 [Clitoria ternatea]|uniref:Uncharacterized protein n=1 Tax=Clitoria ternatea TaxID=43366 RepID=A0AAN9J802_CLITE
MSQKQILAQSTSIQVEDIDVSNPTTNDDSFTQTQSGSNESNQSNDYVSGGKRQNWLVQLINAEGMLREDTLKARDVWLLELGDKVVVPWDGAQPTGTPTSSLLTHFLGLLVRGGKYFPISFKTWKKVPLNFKDEAWQNVIKKKAQDTCEQNAQNHAKLTIPHTGGSKKLKKRVVGLQLRQGSK